LLELAAQGGPWSEVFAQTAQLAKGEKESLENVLDVFYSVVNDLLELNLGPKSCVLRNPDMREELQALSKKANLEWVADAVGGLDELHARLRRNINRQLGLDRVAVGLGSFQSGSAR